MRIGTLLSKILLAYAVAACALNLGLPPATFWAPGMLPRTSVLLWLPTPALMLGVGGLRLRGVGGGLIPAPLAPEWAFVRRPRLVQLAYGVNVLLVLYAIGSGLHSDPAPNLSPPGRDHRFIR